MISTKNCLIYKKKFFAKWLKRFEKLKNYENFFSGNSSFCGSSYCYSAPKADAYCDPPSAQPAELGLEYFQDEDEISWEKYKEEN
jgi:hypothetical protein